MKIPKEMLKNNTYEMRARTYPGAHEWKNWRAAFAEFCQMVFQW